MCQLSTPTAGNGVVTMEFGPVLSCPTCHVPSTERTAAAFDHLIPLFEAFHRRCSEPIPQKEAETITEFSEVSLHKAFQA